MRALHVLLIAAAGLTACAGDSIPRPSSAPAPPASQPPRLGEPVAERVFTLPRTTAVANAPPVSTAESPAETCLSATWEGPLGNCLEPSLVIEDTCNSTRYSLGFNACTKGVLDTSGLVGTEQPPITAWMGPSGAASRLGSPSASHVPGYAATAIRGRLDRAIIQMSGASFDVEIDFLGESGRRTVHLVGKVSR